MFKKKQAAFKKKVPKKLEFKTLDRPDVDGILDELDDAVDNDDAVDDELEREWELRQSGADRVTFGKTEMCGC